MAQMLETAPNITPAQLQQQLVAGAAAGKLSEVPGSGFESFEQVRMGSGYDRGGYILPHWHHVTPAAVESTP
jgi:hypothetical protein